MTTPSPTTARRRTPWLPRRGSALLLAVGVLAVLAIIAISYAASVRTERAATVIYAGTSEYRTQADAVADEIGALITADLFGNKIVTADTPRWIGPVLNPNPVPGVAPPTPNPYFPVWPTMFEDGKFATIPRTDVNQATHTYRKNRPGELFTLNGNGAPTTVGNAGVVLFPQPAGGGFVPSVAPSPESAWLAASDPVDSTASLGGAWDTWPQITNLRSAYRLYRGPDFGATNIPYFWMRDDGRYADLAQFFLSRSARELRKGDPYADLADAPTVLDPNPPYRYWRLAQRDAPFLGVNQAVYKWPMASLSEAYHNAGTTGPASINIVFPDDSVDPTYPREPDALDERFWADTDGDTRPDARWQVLDSIDGRFGLRWVVAARIIDNSSRINVNTAMDSGYVRDTTAVASSGSTLGYTPFVLDPANSNNQMARPLAIRTTMSRSGSPADIDLFRFLYTANLTSNLSATIPTTNPPAFTGSSGDLLMQVDQLDWGFNRPAWRRHLDAALRTTDLVNLVEPTVLPPTQSFLAYGTNIAAGDNRWRYTAGERERIYKNFGVSGAGLTGDVTPYGETEEVDLRTYDGLNNDRILSRLEQRLDFGYLPSDPNTLGGRALDRTGPLRAANPTLRERNPGVLGSTNAADQPRPTATEVRDSVRRYLTTVSGVADFSPVPVLNRGLWPSTTAAPSAAQAGTPIFPQSANRKVRLDDFVGKQPTATAADAASFTRRADLVKRSFESFVWALAPLATDKPLIPGMAQATLNGLKPPAATAAAFDPSNVRLNNFSSFCYGGGTVLSPATLATAATPVELDGPAAAIGRANGVDMGASYALLRAAALAVNLADAVDKETDAGAPPEIPTIARLYNRVYLKGDPNGRPDAAALPGVIPLTARFSQGDIADPANGGPHLGLLPDRYVGAPDAGVTLIGLDKPLFLREAASVAVYQDANAPNGSLPPVQVDPSNVRCERGSLVAFEIGNPWPVPVPTNNYQVRIQNSRGSIEFTLPAATIGAGKAVVFFYSTPAGSATNPDNSWQDFLDTWRAHLGIDAAGVSTPITAAPTLTTVSGGPAASLSPVMYQPLIGSGEPCVVALTYGAGGGKVVIDRMSPEPTRGGETFPSGIWETKTIPYDLVNWGPPAPSPPAPPPMWSGRVAVASSIFRPTGAPTAPGATAPAGFPAYVIEHRAANYVNRVSPTNDGDNMWLQRWLTSAGQVDPGPAALIGNNTGTNRFPPDFKGTVTAPTPGMPQARPVGIHFLGQSKGLLNGMPSFQLFSPDAPLTNISELGMLSAFCTMYVHAAGETGVPPITPTNVVNMLLAANALPKVPQITTEGYWLTLSEQLGDPANFYAGLPSTGVPANGFTSGTDEPPANASLGTLDLSRYALQQFGAPPWAGPGPDHGMRPVPVDIGFLPPSLSLPLAARVFDAFESRPTGADALARGVININTAPLRVLRMLPWVSPWHPIFSEGYDGWLNSAERPGVLNQNGDRAALLVNYRDSLINTSNPSPSDRSIYFVLPGMRTAGISAQPMPYDRNPPNAGVGPSPGVASLGEIPLLTIWGFNATPSQSTTGQRVVRPFNNGNIDGFGDLAAGLPGNPNTRMNPGVPATLTTGVVAPDGVLGKWPHVAYDAGGGLTGVTDPVDDAEQRLGVFRGMANAVSTRSDVFTAWYIVRAYDPKLIASIDVLARAPSPLELRDAMARNQPVYESRWMVVYDRSNVRTPADRPRVLMKVELPLR